MDFFSANNITLVLGAWGAFLSTVLAAVKIIDFYQTRFKIKIGYQYTIDSFNESKIYIQNLSGNSEILEFWELLYCSGRWPFRKLENANPCEEPNYTIIPSRSVHTLYLSETDSFLWRPKARKKRSIFIRLHFSGRKVLLEKICS